MLVDFLLQLAVGRLVLAWLPPGWPGYADRGELGATLSASWLLGFTGLALLPYWWAWALVLVVRITTLPGALRPRHAPPAAAWGLLHALVFVSCLTAQLWGHDSPAVWLAAIAWLVTAPLVWFQAADRRARALGVAALASLVVVVLR